LKKTHDELNLNSLLEDLQQHPETSSQELSLHETPSQNIPSNLISHLQDRWNVRPIDFKMNMDPVPMIKDSLNQEECSLLLSQQDIDFLSSERDLDSLIRQDDEFLSSSSLQSDSIMTSEDTYSRNPSHVPCIPSKSIKSHFPSDSDIPELTVPLSSTIDGMEQDWFALCSHKDFSSSPSLLQNDSSELSIPSGQTYLRVYWIDAYEHSGILYLFGKVRKGSFFSYYSLMNFFIFISVGMRILKPMQVFV
jgi:hypothetical protein